MVWRRSWKNSEGAKTLPSRREFVKGKNGLVVVLLVDYNLLFNCLFVSIIICFLAMQLGLDRLLKISGKSLSEKRIGILGHQASLDSKGRHILDILVPQKDWNVTTLFGPEHGLSTRAQDMEPVKNGKDPKTGLPIFSLYGHTEESLKPSKAMLDRIDTLVIDLQDIGSRYYTYIWTISLFMREAAKFGKKIILCDRPNRINGIDVEGEPNQKGFTSFVGLYSIPVRHGMTIGELASYINATEKLGCDLTVVPMKGWDRKWYWEETKIKWHNPSPNMRSPLQALLYPGNCLLEATNVSEGRGTDTPFEICGAPWVDAQKLIDQLKSLHLEGVDWEPATFTPTRQKWVGKKCEGVRFIVTDRKTFRPYAAGVALIWVLYQLFSGKGFELRKDPYEFISDIPAIDLLTGSRKVR